MKLRSYILVRRCASGVIKLPFALLAPVLAIGDVTEHSQKAPLSPGDDIVRGMSNTGERETERSGVSECLNGKQIVRAQRPSNVVRETESLVIPKIAEFRRQQAPERSSGRGLS